MLNIIQIPSINPLKFYFQSDVMNTATGYPNVVYNSFPSNQNYRNFDEDFFHRNLRSWVDKWQYFQPWQQGDKIVLQFFGVGDGAFSAYTFSLIDKNGRTVKTINTVEGAEVGTGSGIFIRTAVMYLYDVPEGKYMPQICKVQPAFGVGTYFFPAEPIEVKAYHEDTELIRYKHSENAYDVIWETGIEMWIRVPLAFTKLTPGSEYNVYNDDTYNLTLLSGVKYRDWQLSFGVGSKPISMYLFDKLEEICLCDTLYIGNKLYTRKEDSKLEPVPIEKSPLLTGNIDLREKINEMSLTVSFYPAIVLGVAPSAEWFSIDTLAKTTPATSYPINSYFNGAKNFVDYLNALNNIGVIDHVNTFFAIDPNDQIVLMTNDSTVYAAFSPGLIYTGLLEGHLLVDVKTTNTETDLVIQFANSIVSTKYKYYYGDGTTDSGNSTGATKTKTYPGSTALTAKLFWDQAEEIYLDASDQIIQAIEGLCPRRMITFDCSANQLKLIKNNIFADMGAQPSNTNFQLWGNRLDKFAIDAIIRYAYDSIPQFNVPAGIDMQSQAPVASHSTEEGMAYIKNSLLAAGITILTD